MTLTALIILAVALAALWRLARLVIRLVLIAAIVAVGGWYLHHHTTNRAPTGSAPTQQVQRNIDREVHNLTGDMDRVVRDLTTVHPSAGSPQQR